jgi:hypothetical protein
VEIVEYFPVLKHGADFINPGATYAIAPGRCFYRHPSKQCRCKRKYPLNVLK